MFGWWIAFAGFVPTGLTSPLGPPSTAAKVGTPYIHNYTPDEYGAESQNWDVVQDHRGLMYFANSDGVLIYDGVSWRLVPSSSKGRVRSLAIDHQGIVYAGGVKDFGYLATDKTGTTAFRSLLEHLPEKHRQFGEIWSIEATTHGIYFVADRSIYRWSDSGVEVIPIGAGNKVVQINDDLLMWKSGKGWFLWREGNMVLLPQTEFLAQDEYRRSIGYPYGTGRVLFAAERKGFYLYELAKAKTTPPPTTPLVTKYETELDEFVRHNRLSAKGSVTREGNFVLNTMRGGVAIMSPAGKIIAIINEQKGLTSGVTSASTIDRDGNLWLAMGMGISHVRLNSPWTRFDVIDDIQSNITAARVHQGTFYLGTINGLYYLPPYRHRPEGDIHRLLPVKNITIQCFALFSYGSELLAGVNDTFYLVRGDQGTELAQVIESGGIIWSAIPTGRFPDHYVVGLYGRGLIGLQINQRGSTASEGRTKPLTLRQIKMNRPPIAGETFDHLAVDNHGDVWASTTHNGIFRLRFTGDTIEEFVITRYGPEHGLPSDEGNRIQFVNGELIVTTTKGIYHPKPANDQPPDQLHFAPDPRFSQHREETYEIYSWGDHLIADGVAGPGMWRPSGDAFTWDPNPFRGLPTTKQGWKNWWIMDDGTVWIGYRDTVFRRSSSLHKNYEQDYPAFVRRVETKDRTPIFNGNHPAIPLNEAAQHTTRIAATQPDWAVHRIDHERGHLTFEFAAAFYEGVNQNRFSYRLEGFDREFSPWSRDTKKEYTNLPEGSYTFQVKAKNIYDHQSTIATYRFVILPPWYRTTPAYGLYVLAFLLFTYSVSRLYYWRQIRARKRLTRMVKERTAEVVTKNEQLKQARDALWGEMQLAQKIQTVLLPHTLHIPGYDISAYMQTADEVGGDYYDVINCGDHHWLVIGDVSGHGVSAGLVMMMAQTSIHSVLENHSDESPAQLLQTVNRVLYQNIAKLGQSKYMTLTAFYCTPTGKLLFSGLHQDILVFRHDRGSVDQVETNGIWLGIADEIGELLPVGQLDLDPGDVMLLYTDGITEAQDHDGEMFSVKRLAHQLKQHGTQSVTDIQQSILTAIGSHFTSKDDITMVVIKREI